MYEDGLPPPPRNSRVAQRKAAQDNRRNGRNRRDSALTDPDATLRRFSRISAELDPAAHRHIPLAPFVICISAAVLLIGFMNFGGFAVTPPPLAAFTTAAPHAQNVLADAVAPVPSARPTAVGASENAAAPRIQLPAMDDASMQPANGALIHLDSQAAELLNRWGGATGALCQVRLSDGREPWVPCWRIGQPDATPAPTTIPVPTSPPPPPPTNTPAPPCASASGIHGQFQQCGWDPGLQATVEAQAGATLHLAPPPTVCASSGQVQVCGVTGPATLQNQADSLNAATQAAAPAPIQTIR